MVLLSTALIGAIASYLQLASSIPTFTSNSQPRWRDDLASRNTLKRSSVISTNNASCTNGPSSRGCWGGGFDINTDSETSWPVTGVTKSYELEITNTTMAPDGTERLVFAINGQFPGPAIVADWGDTLSITVKNSLQNNGTGIHWHGLQQKNSNNMDGVNGITECPIAPGSSKTYTFLANQYGTTWYHSHHSVQYGDGVVGPIVINGPASANYDIDLGPTTISDWYYITGTQIDHRMMFGAPPITADNGLINGTMVSVNGGSYAKTTLQPGKTHLLRLINTSVDNHFKVHLDGHLLKVIQADFVAIEPVEVDWLFIGIGQRYDVLITANETVDNYWFRAEVQSACGQNANNGNIKAIFSYAGADSSSEPTSTSTTYTQSCSDQTDLVPYVKKDVPSSQFQAHNQQLGILLSTGTKASWSTNGTSVVQWSFDSNLMTIDWRTPTLTSVFAGDTTNFKAERNIIELPNANEWTFWIIQAIPGEIGTAPHPIHLHGHDFHVLGSGTGNFSDATALNYENPTRRDVAMIPADGWLVLAFLTDNPGAWLMHCHIAWHVSEGLAVQFLERASEIPQTFQLGGEYYDNCQKWDDYYTSALYPQLESGL